MKTLKIYLFLLITFCSFSILQAYTLTTGDVIEPFGNTDLSRYIAEQMLAHEEEINISSFLNSEDTKYVNSAIDEAYKQNPLIDCVYSICYNATDRVITIKYLNTKEVSDKNMSLTYIKACSIRDHLGLMQKTELNKELDINNYIIGNTVYDQKAQDILIANGKGLSKDYLIKYCNSFTPYGCLIEGKGVCEAYAEGFHLLATVSDLKCIIVTGYSNGILHEWCKVRINGKWYNVDPTKNDNNLIVNAYLNLSDKEFSTVAISDNTSILPEFNDMYFAINNDLEYYKLMGKTVLTSQEAVDKLAQFLKNRPVNATITLRFYNNLSKEQVNNIMHAVSTKLNITKYRCTFKGNFLIVTPLAYMKG